MGIGQISKLGGRKGKNGARIISCSGSNSVAQPHFSTKGHLETLRDSFGCLNCIPLASTE